jgi:hypothetical protein
LKKTVYLLPLLAFLFAACEVEFSPNAEWKETPVVYCLLDQDDDTTWVRVEKCFLGENSIYSYGSISDSINYPQGSIEVHLQGYRWGQLKSDVTLQYAERDRVDGNFVSRNQPIYYTDSALNETFMYKLEVRRTADGSLLASTDSIPLILQTEEQVITKPYSSGKFGFHSSSQGTPVCHIEWNALQNARRYQPFVRFYYGEGDDTLSVDLMCESTTALSTDYSRSSFLNSLKMALQDDPNPKKYLEIVDSYLTACDENLNVYMMSVNSGVGMEQTTDTYTNIRGGVGVFAARRTHLYKFLNADNSMNPLSSGNPGLHAYLKDLGVGFE